MIVEVEETDRLRGFLIANNHEQEIKYSKLIYSLNTLDKEFITDINIKNKNLEIDYDRIKIIIKNYKHIFRNYPLKKLNKKVIQILDTKHTKLKLKDNKKKKTQRRAALIGAVVVLTGIKTGPLLFEDKQDTNSVVPTNGISDSYLKEDTNKKFVVDISSSTDVNICDISYENRSNTDRALMVKNNCYNIIEKYASIYGIDPKIMLGIATQERSEHSSIIDDGGAIGQMQIQWDIWVDNSITAYNYQTGDYETEIVDGNKLEDLDYNIKIGCMIYNHYLQNMDYNIPAAIQCYNFGPGNMDIVLNACSQENGTTKQDLLKNNDIRWIDYRYLIEQGDDIYLEHVLSWLEPNISFSCSTPDGNTIITNVINHQHTNVL